MRKRYIYAGLSLALLACLTFGAVSFFSSATANPDPKAVICHCPPGNPANNQTLLVSSNAAAAHIAHGDAIGPCPEVIPTDPFDKD